MGEGHTICFLPRFSRRCVISAGQWFTRPRPPPRAVALCRCLSPPQPIRRGLRSFRRLPLTAGNFSTLLEGGHSPASAPLPGQFAAQPIRRGLPSFLLVRVTSLLRRRAAAPRRRPCFQANSPRSESACSSSAPASCLSSALRPLSSGPLARALGSFPAHQTWRIALKRQRRRAVRERV
jgi:hypothetical protein